MGNLSVEAQAVLDAAMAWVEAEGNLNAAQSDRCVDMDGDKVCTGVTEERELEKAQTVLYSATTTYTRGLERGADSFVPTVDQPLGRSSKAGAEERLFGEEFMENGIRYQSKIDKARAALVEAAIDWYTVTGIVIEAAEEAGESSLNLNDKVRAYRRALSGEKGGGVMGAERQRLTKKIRPRSKKDLTFSRKTPLIPPIGGQGGI